MCPIEWSKKGGCCGRLCACEVVVADHDRTGIICASGNHSQILYGTWLLQKIGVCEHSPDVESSVICIKLFVISHIST